MGQKPSQPVSKHTQRQLRREEELQIHMTAQRMENFILLAYMVGNKKHSLCLILSSYQARLRFNEFLAKDRRVYDLYVWVEIIRAMSTPYAEIVARAEKIYQNHLRPNCERSMFIPVAFLTREKLVDALRSNSANDLRAALAVVADDILSNLASTAWLRYVQSKAYATWRSQERAHAGSLTVLDLEAVNELSSIVSSNEDSMFSHHSANNTLRRVHSEAPGASTQSNGGIELKFGSSTDNRKVGPTDSSASSSPLTELNQNRGASKKVKSYMSKYPFGNAVAMWFFSKRNDANPNFKPNPVSSDIAEHCTARQLRPLPRKETLIPPASCLTQRSRFQADFAHTALSAVAPLALMNVMNNGSQWLLMFLAGVEGVPLCVSLHSPLYRRESDVAFPCIYANRYHESVFNVDRSQLLGESISLLYDDTDCSRPVDENGEFSSLKFTPSTSMRDVYLGLSRGVPAIFCRMINPVLFQDPCLASHNADNNIFGNSSASVQNPSATSQNSTFDPGAVEILNSTAGVSVSSGSNMPRYNGVVVGMKPIFACDKRTIIGVVAIQQKINSKEKWAQGYKYIEDMIALIPEECDLRESEGSYNFATMDALSSSDLGMETYKKYTLNDV